MILLIDNYDSFTWNLVQRLGELDPSLDPDRDLRVVRNDKITPDEALALDDGRGPSHVIISPGPCTPGESGVSREIIRAFAGRAPVLGVCLGHQSLADLHGLPVVRHDTPVHGKTAQIHHDGLGVYAGLSDPFVATRYHSLIVPVEAVPQSGPWTVSAWAFEPGDEPGGGGDRKLVMGLRLETGPGRPPVEGVQFHPESFMTHEGPLLLANFLRSGERGRQIDQARAAGIRP